MSESVTRYAVCNLCEAMCGLRIEVSGDRVMSIQGDENDPLSRGHICPKAVALQDVRDDPDRLRRPVRRTADGWREISWDEAFDLVAKGLARTRKLHGADAVGVYLGNPVVHSLGTMTHLLPFARMLGTRSRFSAASVDQLPFMIVSYLLYGNQWLMPIPDVDRTDYFLIFGANPAVSNGSMMSAPGIGRRLKELRDRGGRSVLFDPRRTESARLVSEHHFVRPGTDAALIFAMVTHIIGTGLARPAAYVHGLDEVAAALAAFTPERAAAVTGVPAETIRRVAHEFATAGAAAAYGRTGVSTQRFGALCQWGIQLLNLVTGNLDRPGGTLFARPAVDPIAARQVEPGHYGEWRSRVRGLPEFGGELPLAALAEEIATPGEGRVRALLTVAGNPVLSAPGGDRLAAALPKLDFMACVDFYVNETTRHADVILPPTDLLERDHYDLVLRMFGVRDTARHSPPVFARPDGARHDWEIFRELGRRYHRLTRAGSPLDRLVLRLSPLRLVDLALRTGPYRLSLAKVTGRGVDLGPLRPSLPRRLRTRGKRIDLAPAPLLGDLDRAKQELIPGDLERAERELLPGDASQLLLIGRRHLRDNNSWLHNSPRLAKGRPRHRLLMHPSDLDARGLADGQRVRLRSRSGEVAVEVSASEDIMPGVVSLPHGYGHALDGVRLATARGIGGVSANDVTDPGLLDHLGGTAALNGVPVTVEKA
ncbi:molybdopterin-dependent oxidoreductase [Nonomuraea sp. NN258]|uniref:molybdopterin-dependent oxidoreductase n=1 Tax=Nonomuraea antri TaxID=2730852 RepID=UPI00156A0DDA|nr:molybdopterin-dependent oxidoreductase [Nonomuraea antri]NRQ38959.1 molybdopterin-dependent oxidoreductase [Nonomuraea antri]